MRKYILLCFILILTVTMEGKMAKKYSRPADELLRKRLTPLQYKVTREEATEPPFRNEFWNHKTPGIYVDIVSGEPLFSSLDKFDSKTGWPSFTKPLAPENIAEKEDRGLFMRRVEVRSKGGDSHLGHVFEDGPAPTGLRYCINSASLRFIPMERLKEEGHGEYLLLFEPAQKTAPKNLETATLAGGCFWGVEEIMMKIPGVVETLVGYTGGKTENPVYESVTTGLTGHAETLQIKFDPARIGYKEILDYFFRLHDPTTQNRQGPDIGTQYRSAIFYHSQAQQKTAEEARAQVDTSGKWKNRVVTEILSAGRFYPAEEEHQKYILKNPQGYHCPTHYLRQ